MSFQDLYLECIMQKNNEDRFSIWGSGKPLREFLYVDDLSEAIKLIIEKDVDQQILNVGSSEEISIIDLQTYKKVLQYDGELIFDSTKLDGNPRKLLDSTKMFSYGWKPNIRLEEGIKLSYDWFLKTSA